MSLNRRRFIIGSSATLAALAFAKTEAMAKAQAQMGLRDYFQGSFLIGTAIGGKLMSEMPDHFRQLVTREFSAITMENDMKWELLHPAENQWNWDIADKFVAFGKRNDMYVVGHVLVWHSQVPAWVFKRTSRKALLARMQEYIGTVAGRYQGKINAWDVVNEAVDEGKGWRKSPWFNIIGPDFVEHAFRYAHEADPSAQLIYNDYNMHLPAKREFVVDMVKRLQKRGVPIHGIGMQGHVGLGYPDINEFEQSIKAYARLGVRVHITEFDIDVLPVAWEHTGAEISDNFAYSEQLNPYSSVLPLAVERELSDRYVEFFKLFLKHKEVIERVTLWGTGDAESWKNNFPVRGRVNYPLLFDRKYQKKPSYHAVVSLANR